LSVAPAGALPELSLRHESQGMNPLDDLSLVDAAMAPRAAASVTPALDLDRIFGAPAAAAEPPRKRAVAAHQGTTASREELPLFGPPIPDDEPLITKVSPPRTPLAVRRGTPEVNRLRAEMPRPPALDLDVDAAAGRFASPVGDEPPTQHAPRNTADRQPPADEASAQDAGVGARFLAVAIDLVILAIIDAVVIYFTMQICAISVDDLGLLPKGPLIAFLFVQNGGYLVAFTAGGQTLGKMAAGIRVVPNESAASLDLGHAFLRTLMWVVLAVPAGLGFLTALLSRDRRGLHDRFAGTRVVRASA
jgi:uncharacterized RDD family membrane protein YckC